MNAHIKKVEFNIPRGQFLPHPPVLAPLLQPIMTDEEKLVKESEDRRLQQLFRELISNPHVFIEDMDKQRKKPSSARKAN